jgi:hypothetical protein
VQHRLRQRDQTPLRGLPRHAVQPTSHDRPCVHIQTNTRRLTKHWGLPQCGANEANSSRQSTSTCE